MLYDITSPTSIEQYAKLLENKAIYEVIPTDLIEKVNKKGGIGTLIEEHHFGYKPNSKNEADFPEAGVELKVTPYRKNKRGTFSAKERLVLNIINYMDEYKHSFEDSSFWKKNKLLLLIFYLYDENLNRHDFKFTHSQLFAFYEKDLEIIKQDWEIIINKIKEGRAHELSEKDTVYLSAATKGMNKNSLRNQPFSSERAMQRAFSLKSSYMTFILNQYILNRKKTYQPILDTELAKRVTIDEYVLNSIRPNLGKRLSDLCDEFGVPHHNKSRTQQVIARMVSKDLKDLNKSEEFIKSNTKIKAIRIQKNCKIKESMSFPSFKYKEIIQEDWEDSSLRLMFQETRFLFTLYVQTENDDYKLTDAFFWSLPEEDLEEEVRRVWEETVNRILAHRADRLPGSSENRVAHVRPHAANSEDTYPTHYGVNIVKKCFWLNNSYILGEVLKNSPTTKNRLPK
ncbi:restriction endonuclease [Bacillus sp. FJAT-42376]|uniref:Sau3AI family type II restriction endonuclease n=1 Tax=Bacillus sp. FJAT-42376 TaxID=2014076 RepID=UPI000F4F80EC|nr:Sau3AI family type II restriction endonuclease [Bacillus sp. FJAT-42376]AZB41513.1 restriction endonuclease [Bacillus sp. FJAT-42376]